MAWKPNLSQPNYGADYDRLYGKPDALQDPNAWAHQASYASNRKAYQSSQQQQAAAAAGPQAPDRIDEARKAVFAGTDGRGQATLDDPYLGSAMKRLDEIQSGKQLPYSQQVKDQMLARQGDMSSAAEGANANSIREAAAARGGSANDPAVQAQLMQGQQQRQQANNAAAGDIDTQATLANFSAQNQATNSLMGGRLNQLGHADNQFNQGAAYHAMETQAGPHVNGNDAPWTPSWNSSMTQPSQQNFGALFVPQYDQNGNAGGQGGAVNPMAQSHPSVWAGSGQQNPAPVYGAGPAAGKPPQTAAQVTAPWAYPEGTHGPTNAAEYFNASLGQSRGQPQRPAGFQYQPTARKLQP